MRQLFLVVLFCLFSLAFAQYGTSTPVNVSFTITSRISLWLWTLVHLPSDYSTSPATQRYPLMVFFHGAGQATSTRAETDLVNLANTFGPCTEIAKGNPMEFTVGGVLYKFIVVCPQWYVAPPATLNGRWPQDGVAQNGFLNEIFALYPKADPTRVYFTGLSDGGFSLQAYTYAQTAFATRLAAHVPVSSNTPTFTCVAANSNLPMWMIYGNQDTLATADANAVANYKTCQPREYDPVSSIVIGGHNAATWNQAYSTDHSVFNPNIYEWMLNFSRSATAPPTAGPTPVPTPKATPAPTPAPTAAPTCVPVLGSGTGLRGEYYSGVNFNSLEAIIIDPQINFNWGTGAPSAGADFPVDTFSVRWTGTLKAKYSGTHTFTANSDDGVNVTIGGTKIISDWTGHAAHDAYGFFQLTAGQSYPIEIDYYEALQSASVSLSWTLLPCLPKEIIPKSQLTPSSFSVCA